MNQFKLLKSGLLRSFPEAHSHPPFRPTLVPLPTPPHHQSVMKIISFIPPFLSSSKLKKRSAKERRSVSRSDNSSFASTTSTSSEDLSPTPRSILSRTITGRELEVVLRHLDPDGPTEAEVLAVLSDVGVSVSQSGRIALAELTTLGGAGESDEMRETFAVFDVNGDGKISAEELMALFATLGEGCSIEECRRMIGEVDSDGDGFVCFEDFVRMMNGQR